jgi:hypothetical protein
MRMHDSAPHRIGQIVHALEGGHDEYSLLGPDPMVLLSTLFVLLTVGQVLLTLLITTLLLSKRVRRRNATLINLLLVCIASTIPPPLL